MQVFDADGQFLAEWADLPHADSIVFRKRGGAYVGSGRDIIQVDDTGRPVAKIGHHAIFGYPHGLREDADGNLYVADP